MFNGACLNNNMYQHVHDKFIVFDKQILTLLFFIFRIIRRLHIQKCDRNFVKKTLESINQKLGWGRNKDLSPEYILLL